LIRFSFGPGRLGLDRADIRFCHDIDVWTHGAEQPGVFETAINGILPALADLRSAGVIGALGLGVNEWQVCSMAKKVSVIIGGPYNSGILATPDRARATYDYKPVDDARWQKAQAIRAICDLHEVDIRAAALQYPLRHPAVAAVIPGMCKLGELETNLGLMEIVIAPALEPSETRARSRSLGHPNQVSRLSRRWERRHGEAPHGTLESIRGAGAGEASVFSPVAFPVRSLRPFRRA
jgi:aryl-alcohol dehydrogenase-like predicted oxidoreductase